MPVPVIIGRFSSGCAGTPPPCPFAAQSNNAAGTGWFPIPGRLSLRSSCLFSSGTPPSMVQPARWRQAYPLYTAPPRHRAGPACPSPPRPTSWPARRSGQFHDQRPIQLRRDVIEQPQFDPLTRIGIGRIVRWRAGPRRRAVRIVRTFRQTPAGLTPNATAGFNARTVAETCFINCSVLSLRRAALSANPLPYARYVFSSSSGDCGVS